MPRPEEPVARPVSRPSPPPPPPPFNRRYLESRLAYRIQELAYGGLKPETIRRLERLGEDLFGADGKKSRMRTDLIPITGTRLLREWQGVEHVVTVTQDGFELAGAALPVNLGHCARPSPAHAGTAGCSSGSRTIGGRAAMNMHAVDTRPVVRKLRCAVYTRKSSEEGLEQEFNSLHAQREGLRGLHRQPAAPRAGCWSAISMMMAASLAPPSSAVACSGLMADIEEGLVDVVVVYKIDRLSRSLADFAKLVEVFDRNGVTFVSDHPVLQYHTSIGATDAQHPSVLCPVRAERSLPSASATSSPRPARRECGWEAIHPSATTSITASWWWTRNRPRMCAGCSSALSRSGRGRSSQGRSTSAPSVPHTATGSTKKYIYRMLSNRAYIGEAVHKGESYPGEHDAIIDREVWDKVSCHPDPKSPPEARRPHPRRHTCIAEGVALWPRRRGVLAHAYTQRRAALPLTMSARRC